MGYKEKSDWYKKVRKAMLDKGMKYPDLAIAADYSESYVKNVVNGVNNSDVAKERINAVLGIEE